jgi:hypothetical protein
MRAKRSARPIIGKHRRALANRGGPALQGFADIWDGSLAEEGNATYKSDQLQK